MDRANGRLTVCFEDPFWIGIFERVINDKLYVAKVTFGSEPKDYEVYDFVKQNYFKLRYSPGVDVIEEARSISPKRRQREAKRQVAQKGIGTKSQIALQLQREEFKTERKLRSKEEKLEEAARKFELRQQKKKERHRGRA